MIYHPVVTGIFDAEVVQDLDLTDTRSYCSFIFVTVYFKQSKFKIEN